MEILVLIIVVAVVSLFIYRPLQSNNMNDNSSNVAISKRKLVELENDLAQQLISQEYYATAKQEITQNLANELSDNGGDEESSNTTSDKLPHLIVATVATIIISLSISFYMMIQPAAPLSAQDSLNILVQETEDNPKDSKAWQMLGSAYSMSGENAKSIQAYETAYNLGNKNLDLLTEYASLIALENDGNFAGKPSDLIKEALEIDKNSVKALYLAGIIAANSGMFDLAKGLWEKALSLSVKGSENEKMITGVLQQLKDFTAQKPPVAINVVVEINEELYKNHFDDFIMIYAKNAIGRPMPIAIVKEKLQDFSGLVELSDANSVMPTIKLSDAQDIVIVARISKSGNAMKQEGDIEIISKVMKSESQTVELTF